MPKTERRKPTDPVERELNAIKRLLVLLLLKAGANQSELALALKMDRGDVSRMLPARQIKRFEAALNGATEQ